MSTMVSMPVPMHCAFYPTPPIGNSFGQFHPFHPYQLQVPNLHPSNKYQDFQYFVVMDFEATCDKENGFYPQEIIEFPSVIVNSRTGEIEACFQTYVRPTCVPMLTDFCKYLTGIQQAQVDGGVTLSEALIEHDKWLEHKGIKNSNFAVVTWSDSDCKVFLESECCFKNIRKPSYFNRWIDLRVPYSQVLGRPGKLKDAVEKAGLSWEGRAHSGLDDAKNTARLLVQIMHKGFKFSFTSSVDQSNDTSPVQYHPYCFCGVRSSKWTRPGSKNENVFFGCGNWTPFRRVVCQFCEWTSSP